MNLFDKRTFLIFFLLTVSFGNEFQWKTSIILLESGNVGIVFSLLKNKKYILLIKK